jgi:glycosyltransferase involved in cell wall biosynthesis
MPAGKVIVVYDGANVRELAATRSRDDVLREMGLDPARPVAGVIARLDVRKKGQDVFLKAISAVAEAVPEFQFLIVGGGPDERELRNAASVLPPSHQPQFAGFRPDLANVLNAIDVLVIPSRWESVPKILIEAMWCGKAVVATRVGDMAEILEASCGILIPADSPEEMAAALIRLGRDGGLRRRLGEAAHDRIERMGLTLDQTVRRYDNIYQKLLATRA